MCVCVCVCVCVAYEMAVVTHTIHQTEIPTLLDSWVTNTPSVKMLCPQKNLLSFYLRKNILKCWSAHDRSQVSDVSCKFVCCWVSTYCCFMSNICSSHSMECEQYTA